MKLQLSQEKMEEAIVSLPEDIKKMANDKDFQHIPHMGSRVGVGCENMDSYRNAQGKSRRISCR